jgi:predicted RNA-binding protein with PIN domain
MEPFQGATFSCSQDEDLDAVAATLGDDIGQPLVIVDGSNAVHAVAVTGRDHANARGPGARARLLEIVEAALPGRAVVVVFDDAREGTANSFASIDVEYALNADEWIVDRVSDASRPDSVTVITSDRELTRRVVELGARAERPRAALEAGRA